MKIKKLLEYQEVDRQYRNLNKDLKKSNEAKDVSSAKLLAGKAKDALLKMDRMAGELVANFDKKKELLTKAQTKAVEFNKVIDEISDITEIDYVQKKLDELVNECSQLGKDLNKLKSQINHIKVETSEAMKMGKDSSEKYKEAKKSYDALKEELNPQADEFKKKMKKIEDSINDKSLMERYAKLKNNKIFPAVVKCEDTNCMGCGMNIANDLQSKLNSSDELVECPNCGRMMYIEQAK